MTVASQLAAESQEDFPKNLTPLQPEEVQFIEHEIDQLTEKLPPLRNFIIPGGHVLISYTHLARSVCRRAERYVTELDHQAPVSATLIAYVNRLSDYFFTLSRMFALDLEIEEVKWNGN
jgi:cob(I)alamin adenosyltransferase|tara:strand:- start:21 stop:377 length:357 start_codon:yes stop_codon:yes gene_type:complete